MSILDEAALGLALDELGLGRRADELLALGRERLSPVAHGDFRRWQGALEKLPRSDGVPRLDRDVVAVGGSLDGSEERRLVASLEALVPWRKGPFEVCGVGIDAEWRSDLKWRRVAPAVAPLAGRLVLDVGCGNGYYLFRMLGAGARRVLGLDPTTLYVMQFLAIRRYAEVAADVLPIRLSELAAGDGIFDTTFSMGVLYHQRSPLSHLDELRATLRPGGQLVLETLYLPGEEQRAVTPPERYARMRNVWLLPTLAELGVWLERSGYRDIAVADCSRTTTDEQRRTAWMPFESLAGALDPADAGRTVEGWPAPRRVVVTATAP